MSIYEQLRAEISVPEAAAHYGMEVRPGGMVRCPFHPDRNPSMKLYPQGYHCFGCQAHGDVVGLVAGLMGVGQYAAAKQLAMDYGITPDREAAPEPRRPRELSEQECWRGLKAYLAGGGAQSDRAREYLELLTYGGTETRKTVMTMMKEDLFWKHTT